MLQLPPPPLASLRGTLIVQHPKFNLRLMLQFYVVSHAPAAPAVQHFFCVFRDFRGKTGYSRFTAMD
jgi:hypothetical protein